jgi:hypothetical protein
MEEFAIMQQSKACEKCGLDETTWRDTIVEARPFIAVDQSSDAPEKTGGSSA